MRALLELVGPSLLLAPLFLSGPRGGEPGLGAARLSGAPASYSEQVEDQEGEPTGSGQQEHAIEVLVPGMTVTTSNSVGSIEVRAKSLGPGFCAVTYSSRGEEAVISAPPLKYSDWSVLLTHIGSSTNTISESVQCDGLVVAQVRYWKPK